MSLLDRQAERIDAILPWARTVGRLRGVWRPHEQRVHLRPSGTGIRLVDLQPDRPQLDRGKISHHDDADQVFRRLLDRARTNSPGRSTPEKRLQSWLLMEAYRCDGRLTLLAPDLTLVTDEQRFPGERKEFACDLLAMRGTTPVVIELKSAREMKRLSTQLEMAAAIVDAHRARFADLFGAVLGRGVELDRPCERWLVWPGAAGRQVDPRARELRDQGGA